MHNVHFHPGVCGGGGGREIEMGGLLCEVSHGCSLSFFGCKSQICVSIKVFRTKCLLLLQNTVISVLTELSHNI